MTDENVTPQTTKIMQVQAPVKGEVVHGATVQTDINGIVKVTKVKLRDEIRRRIAEDNAALSAATSALAAAQDARTKACVAVPVPASIYNDLDLVARALQTFYPGAEVRRTDKFGNPRAAQPTAFNFATGKFSVAANVSTPSYDNLLSVTREYDIPSHVKALDEAVAAAQTDLTDAQLSLQEMRDKLAGLDDAIESMEAAVIADGLKRSESGKQALDAMDKVFNDQIAAMDKRRGRKKS